MGTDPAAVSDREILALVERHLPELRLHCYRMLGSAHDLDDVLQDVRLRAWRGREGLASRPAARAWLYRIATNVCLDLAGRRRRRMLSCERGEPSDEPFSPVVSSDAEPWWLEPFPDEWLGGVERDPAAAFEVRESVTLAFVNALQALTAPQRAALLLRDVVGLSATETAAALGTTVQANESALLRARRALGAKADERARVDGVPSDLLARYVRAWNDGDLDAFIALLHDDVVTTMPPAEAWVRGVPAHVAFYRPMFDPVARAGLRVTPIGANAQPALAFYRAEAPPGPRRLRAVHVVDVAAGRVRRIDHFMLPAVFGLFALPDML